MGFHDPNFTGHTDDANLMDDPDALFIASPQEIAALVTAWRRLRGWKQETLAQFAAVSLSTVERIERGEAVSTESLDRVAVALEFKEGDFHRPRSRRGFDESLMETMRFFEGRLAVPCAPLKTQPQAAALLGCQAYLVDDGRCTPDAAEAVAILRENLDVYSFMLSDLAGPGEPVKKREIYTSLLADVQAVERRGYTALHTTYDADSRFGPVKVAVIGFFPKLTDPGAAKREFVLVPTHIG
ncbi:MULTISPECIES: helix-turn-helix domain-containing protein [Azospirillum]|uniref:XRE family transcriptional regulator n=1 Tax=Azospirillum brasilense TaxID=192 RepID=A0A6L3B1U9_AZOBR|nr:helix-turn-helix transcriptional regulator [Azospirillum brasilense]KAA0686243.1 XRE family transcriptional regulator [Azospirillum brasilense]